MMTLKIMNHGEFMEALSFETLDMMKEFLQEAANVDAIFGWILGEEPDAILPDFSSAETADDIADILAEYDYTFWTVTLEEEPEKA